MIACYMLKVGDKYVAEYRHWEGTRHVVALADFHQGLQFATQQAARSVLVKLPPGVELCEVVDG